MLFICFAMVVFRFAKPPFWWFVKSYAVHMFCNGCLPFCQTTVLVVCQKLCCSYVLQWLSSVLPNHRFGGLSKAMLFICFAMVVFRFVKPPFWWFVKSYAVHMFCN